MRLLTIALCVLTCVSAKYNTANHKRQGDPEKTSLPAPHVLNALPRVPKDTYGNPLTNLTVIILPHSHDDTGWQRTVDEYYEEEVQYIYSSVVEALEHDANRRFIFVETAFFMRWWREQSDAMQSRVKRLVSVGQIEVVNGGWCMADDASPSIDAQIDQITLGHRYMRDVLGVVPKYAWHIDPFGLSASYAMMFGQMNFTGWLFNRVDTRY